MNSRLDFRPVIIVGAARSGTNLLRDTLTRLPGYATWPCDELPSVWRHDNLQHPHDEFPAEIARPAVKRYVRRIFSRLAYKSGAQNVVEKTCANTLRVPFIDAILPEAVYLHLTRDGRDVTTSAMQRWTSKVDLSYTLKKVRYLPPSDLPFYAFRFLQNRLSQRRNREGRMAVWGPRFSGMNDCLNQPLAELCARQWQRSINKARHDLSALPAERWMEFSYEEFTAQPAAMMEQVGRFLGEDWTPKSIEDAVVNVRASSVGNWKRKLNAEDRELLASELGMDTRDDACSS